MVIYVRPNNLATHLLQPTNDAISPRAKSAPTRINNTIVSGSLDDVCSLIEKRHPPPTKATTESMNNVGRFHFLYGMSPQ
jgi:hypothetical protein